MGVSENRVPKSSIFDRVFHYKPSISTIFGNIHIEDCNKNRGCIFQSLIFSTLLLLVSGSCFFWRDLEENFSVQAHHFPKSAIVVVVLSERAKVKVEHFEQLEERRNDPGKVDASCNLGLLYCFVAETPDRDFATAGSFEGWIFWKDRCLLVGWNFLDLELSSVKCWYSF